MRLVPRVKIIVAMMEDPNLSAGNVGVRARYHSVRAGPLWVHGAFEPATRQATVVLSPKLDSASHIQLLERMVTEFPAER